MPRVRSRGHAINYRTAGDGPPLVLVSGYTQWAERWWSAGYVDALADRHRVIAIDPLGHGDSDKPHDAGAYDWLGGIADLIAVLDAEGGGSASWWGFSRGAAMVKDLTALHPERVDACVIGGYVETFGAADWPDVPFPELCRTPDGIKQVWASLGFVDPDAVAEALSVNDLGAIGCVADADFADDEEAGEYPRSVPLLSYKGSREGYSDEMQALLDDVGAEQHEVAGANHAEAFARSADVLAFVAPFLARAAGTGA
jgi:pimeloyl-ACP methyl ester carboxylesterase